MILMALAWFDFGFCTLDFQVVLVFVCWILKALKDGRTHRRWYSHLCKGLLKSLLCLWCSVCRYAFLDFWNLNANRITNKQFAITPSVSGVISWMFISAGLSGGVGGWMQKFCSAYTEHPPALPPGASVQWWFHHRACAHWMDERKMVWRKFRFFTPLLRQASNK